MNTKARREHAEGNFGRLAVTRSPVVRVDYPDRRGAGEQQVRVSVGQAGCVERGEDEPGPAGSFPAPTPTSSRPSLMMSMAANSWASAPSGRKATLMTCVPRRILLVTAAAAAIAGIGATMPV
jgi:hypothetical protein